MDPVAWRNALQRKVRFGIPMEEQTTEHMTGQLWLTPDKGMSTRCDVRRFWSSPRHPSLPLG